MAAVQTSSLAGVRVPARAVAVAPTVSLQKNAASLALAGAASLLLTLSANAATVKLGGDDGALVMKPSTVIIAKGESVTWVNNKGFPHNVVFDEDAIPAGTSADALSHEDYLNAAGDSVSTKFDVAGTYGYYCEPHQGAGMTGKIIVQ